MEYSGASTGVNERQRQKDIFKGTRKRELKIVHKICVKIYFDPVKLISDF